ncbi:hypothetical protein AB0F18_04760 [Streptomyces sp. NPDC029216]|uniref:hypothetical protein n=1 Tax=Streptomyces sp. NPDC029216 TaxID=3154701 RepID=UPI0033CE08C7
MLPGQPGHGPRPRLGPLQPGHPRPGGRAQQGGGRGRTDLPPRLRPASRRHQQHPRRDHRDPHPDGTPRPRHPEPEGSRPPGSHGGPHEPQIQGPCGLHPGHLRLNGHRPATTRPGHSPRHPNVRRPGSRRPTPS